jgi:predicted alpha/beta-hydrolase family hydrolase
MTDFLFDGPQDARFTVLLAHGAGAPMDSAAMNATAKALSAQGLRVARFEFAYMASRRTEAGRKPPPKAETVMPEYVAAVEALGPTPGPLVIGGRSMGGRVASMVADQLFDAGRIAGLLCLGYPFHPPGKPEKLRTAHLADLETPALICQGTRDPFGTREEAAAYELSDRIELLWLEDGDHDLKPRKRVTGYSVDQCLAMPEFPLPFIIREDRASIENALAAARQVDTLLQQAAESECSGFDGVTLSDLMPPFIAEAASWPGNKAQLAAAISDVTGFSLNATPNAGAFSGSAGAFSIGPERFLVFGDEALGLAGEVLVPTLAAAARVAAAAGTPRGRRCRAA